MSARALQGSAPVKKRVREYLDAHPGWHSAYSVANEINVPSLDVLEAALELAREGYKMKPAAEGGASS